MNLNFNTYGRVFVNVSPIKGFTYYNAMSVGGIDTTLEKTENVYTYDARGQLKKIAEIIDPIKEYSSSLTGLMPIDNLSNLEKLALNRNINIQVHFGRCTIVNEQRQFDSVLVLKDVNLTNYNISEPTTLTKNKATVQETAAITFANSYRVLNLNYLETFVQSDIFGGDIYWPPSCTDNQSNNPVIIVAYQGLLVQLAYSLDGGLTWVRHPSTLPAHQALHTAATLITAKNKVFWSVLNTGFLKIYAANIDNVLSVNDIEESEIFSKANCDIRDMSATLSSLWSCGRSNTTSLLLKTSLLNHTTEIIDDGALFIVPATALDALSDDFVVIVGDDDIYAIYENDDFFISSIGIDTTPNFSDVKVFTKQHWLIAGDQGLYITIDGGKTWKKTLITSGYTKINFYDEITGYAANNGKIYRTIDGGLTWALTHTSFHTTPDEIICNPKNVNDVFSVFSDGVLVGVA